MNTMNSKERAAFNAQSDAAKFAKLEQYIAKNYASLSKHVKVNNFYHTNTAALTDLSGTSVKRTVSSADNRAIMKSLRPSETVRYNDILTRHEVAIKNVHAEESHYRKLAEKFASAGPKEREVIRKQMTDSATRLTTYERTVKIIEEEKRSFEQKIEARRSAGDIIRAAAGVGSNKNENVLNNYNMRTKGPHGRPIHPGGPLDRPMNMILLRFMERYKNQIQSMYKTEIYQQSQAVLAYTKGKANKLSNDIARTIADNRQLRKFLKGEIAKLENSIKASDVALRNAMSNDIGRLEEAENEMKTRLSSLEIDLSSMEKKIGTATTAVRPTAKPAAKPTTKK
jgi:predicted  nucleic acid-binding Zn-ribbon protein